MYQNSASSTISSILTVVGRQVLARNDGSFRITKFKLGDDEINYQLYNPANIDSEDADIMAIPILEPSTDADSALRFPLVSMAEGTKRVAELVIQPNNILFNINSKTDSVRIDATTLYNEDINYNVSFANINSSYVSSVSVSKNDLYSVTKSADDNSNEYIVNADHNLQISKSSWNVVMTFSNLTKNISSSTNVYLCTMIVAGQNSGVFTTIDLYGNTGAAQSIINNPTKNGIINSNTGGVKTPIIQTDPLNGGGGVSIIGENQ